MPVRTFTDDEKGALRQRMLEAGLPLLKRHGMKHMSVARIAAAAGIGTSTFYGFWRSKEDYVAALADFQEGRIIQSILTPEMAAGTQKPGKEEVRRFLKALVDDSVSIIPWLTLEDESALFQRSDALVPDVEKESAKTRALLAGVEGARDDIDAATIANLVKILALTAESRAELHASAYGRTIDALIDAILRQIF